MGYHQESIICKDGFSIISLITHYSNKNRHCESCVGKRKVLCKCKVQRNHKQIFHPPCVSLFLSRLFAWTRQEELVHKSGHHRLTRALAEWEAGISVMTAVEFDGKSDEIKKISTFHLKIFLIQPRPFAYNRLLNRHYINEDTVNTSIRPKKCCYALDYRGGATVWTGWTFATQFFRDQRQKIHQNFKIGATCMNLL